jgi:hypothetical protein
MYLVVAMPAVSCCGCADERSLLCCCCWSADRQTLLLSRLGLVRVSDCCRTGSSLAHRRGPAPRPVPPAGWWPPPTPRPPPTPSLEDIKICGKSKQNSINTSRVVVMNYVAVNITAHFHICIFIGFRMLFSSQSWLIADIPNKKIHTLNSVLMKSKHCLQ